jgi:predicted DCC family thiol-disulfide oxidoreductase YuxK
MNDDKNIIFFDGNCMLCNSFIAYLVKKKNPNLFFCDINSAMASQLLASFRLQNIPQNTIYFLQDNQLYYKSTAVFKIISRLTPFYKFIASIGSLIPLFIRDGVYSWVAKNRYRFFKQTACYIPTLEEKEKFI